MTSISFDGSGYPVMLAEVEAAPVGDKMIDPLHSEQHDRRRDAVRDAAREFEVFSPQDATDWLRGKTNRALADSEVASFHADVRTQQLDDLVDIVDHRERGGRMTRRRVSVKAPKGYTRKLMNSLDTQEIQQLARRLKARGWSSKDLGSLAKSLPDKHDPELFKV